jgi:hypothetical protein
MPAKHRRQQAQPPPGNLRPNPDRRLAFLQPGRAAGLALPRLPWSPRAIGADQRIGQSAGTALLFCVAISAATWPAESPGSGGLGLSRRAPALTTKSYGTGLPSLSGKRAYPHKVQATGRPAYESGDRRCRALTCRRCGTACHLPRGQVLAAWDERHIVGGSLGVRRKTAPKPTPLHARSNPAPKHRFPPSPSSPG